MPAGAAGGAPTGAEAGGGIESAGGAPRPEGGGMVRGGNGGVLRLAAAIPSGIIGELASLAGMVLRFPPFQCRKTYAKNQPKPTTTT